MGGTEWRSARDWDWRIKGVQAGARKGDNGESWEEGTSGMAMYFARGLTLATSRRSDVVHTQLISSVLNGRPERRSRVSDDFAEDRPLFTVHIHGRLDLGRASSPSQGGLRLVIVICLNY